MMTFYPIPNPEKYTVDHLNMDPLVNEYWNMEWVDQKENNRRKNLNNHSHGVGNYQSIFNLDQLKIIVQELEKGTSYREILNIIGIEDTPNNRDYIGNIKRGKTYQREIRELFNE